MTSTNSSTSARKSPVAPVVPITLDDEPVNLTQIQKKSLAASIMRVIKSLHIKWSASSNVVHQINRLKTNREAFAYAQSFVSKLKTYMPALTAKRAGVILFLLIGSIAMVHEEREKEKRIYKRLREANLKRQSPQRSQSQQPPPPPSLFTAPSSFTYDYFFPTTKHTNATQYDLRCSTQRHTEAYTQWIQHDPIQNITAISGTYGLTRMRLYDNNHCPTKLIYLFHDYHIPGKCYLLKNSVPLVKLLDEFFKRSPYVVDFLFETADMQNLSLQGSTPSELSIQQIREHFWHCFSRNPREKRDCVIGNHENRIRFHFNDFRLKSDKWYGHIVESYAILLYVLNQRFRTPEQDKFIRGLATNLLPLNQSPTQLNQLFRADFKVDRQLDHCPIRVRSIINDWLNGKVFGQQGQFYFKHLRELATMDYQSSIATKFSDYYESLMSLGMYYMDAYTVARMFRTFHPTAGHYSQPMRNIIVNAGGYHIEHYIELLTQLGGYQDFQTTSPDALKKKDIPQCINVSALGGWELLNTNPDAW